MCCVFDALATYNHTTCSVLFQSYLFFVLISFRCGICSSNCKKMESLCFVVIYTEKFVAHICLHKHKTHTRAHSVRFEYKSGRVWSFRKQSTHFPQNNSQQFLSAKDECLVFLVFMRTFAYTLH